MFAAVFGLQDPQFTKPFNKQCIFEADVVMVTVEYGIVLCSHDQKSIWTSINNINHSFSSRNYEIKKERILKKILY